MFGKSPIRGLSEIYPNFLLSPEMGIFVEFTSAKNW